MNRLAFISMAALLSSTAFAQTIHTGGEKGAYHNTFCPPMVAATAKEAFNLNCAVSGGTLDNIAQVLANPHDIGMAQGDVFAKWASENPDPAKKLAIIRDDVARECLFFVTKNENINNLADVSRLASRINFVLPPKVSGSAATFDYISKIDPSILGRASKISYAADASAAIKEALGQPLGITMFVQLPDPTNPNFKLVNELGGKFIPVVSRNMMRVNGDKPVYTVETNDVSEGGWISGGLQVTTSCTPVTFFTGDPKALPDGSNEQKDQQDLITVIKTIDRDALLPKTGVMAKILAKVRDTQKSAVEGLMKLTDDLSK